MYQRICAACMTAFDTAGDSCPACGAKCIDRNPEGALPEGLLLNDTYRVGAFVSLDSEGAVYEATDIVSHRAYRIKEYMPVTLCSGRDADLALQVRPGSEVPYKNNAADLTDLYARLRHFNNDICLLGVREVFYANNTVYAVTEKAEGITLTQYLQQQGGRLGWNDALDLLDPLWVAVERLHRAGILHRGICCDNITVSGPGVVRLGGYATAAMRRQGTELKAQLYAGYAAPEQYDASAFDGPYTDIYALSAVLYRVLTGVAVPAARQRLADDTLEDPTRYANAPLADGSVQRLPLYLADAVLHGLQLDGGERFADMAAFRAALAGQKPKAAAARPARAPGGAVRTEPERKSLWARMNTDLKVGICTGGFLLLVFLIVLLVWSGDKQPPDSSSGVSVQDSYSLSDTVEESPSVDTSSGEPADLAPALVGKKYSDARLEHHGIRFNVEYEYSQQEAGVIIRQSPEPGMEIEDNTVTIIISQGTEPVPLPGLEGSTRASAEALLQGMGLKYEVYTFVNDGSWMEGVVVSTEPGEGAMLQPGIDVVILRVASAPPAVSSSSSEAPSSSEQTPPEQAPDTPPETPPAEGEGTEGEAGEEGEGGTGGE